RIITNVLIVFVSCSLLRAADAVPGTNESTARIVITNLVGVWTNGEMGMLTISSVHEASGAMTGTWRSVVSGSEQVRPFDGLVHTRGVAGDNTNRIRGVSFSVDWGGSVGVKEWTGFYTKFDGKEAIAGIWVRHGQSGLSEFDKQHGGKETFG